jgi:tripartite-type tricarboxylate transporter receptor subunit TctC
MVTNTSVWSAWHTSKIKTADDLFKHEAVAGAGGPTSNSQIIPSMLNQFVGTRFKIVPGYKNSGALDLAMQRGEIDGRSIPLGIYLKDQNVAKGNINPIVQFASERAASLPKVPTAAELVKNKAQSQMVKLVLSGGVMGRSLMGPPEIPADRVKILRTAFDAAMKDPKLIALAKKTQNDLEPLSGAAVTKIVMGLFDVPAEVAKKTADVINAAKKKRKKKKK